LRFVCCFALLLVVASAAALAQEDPDLARIFADRGATGTIVMRSLDGSVAYVHNQSRAKEPFIPASTFKIPNSLIALEEKAIADENEVIKWDGRKQRVEAWNRDHTLETAFKVSCVWFYQELAKRIGKEKYERHLSRIRYGNARPEPDLTTFWLDGDLRISAEEQIDFLARLCRNDLPFQKRSLEIVKRLMIVDQTPLYTIRAKTGWALRVPAQLGWYVGYVEAGGKTWLFATNLDIVRTGDERYRQEITLAALKAKGILIMRGQGSKETGK